MIATRIVAALCALLLCGAVSASSPVVRDANGRVLGYYTGVAYISTMSNSGYLIVSPTGYVYAIDDVDSSFARHHVSNSNRSLDEFVHFTTTDCSGQGYVTHGAGAPISGGFVVQMDDDQIYFATKSVSTEQISARSRRTQGGICQNFPAQSYSGVRVEPNDPDVTGVPGDIPIGQPEIAITTVGASLFSDGFELPA